MKIILFSFEFEYFVVVRVGLCVVGVKASDRCSKGDVTDMEIVSIRNGKKPPMIVAIARPCVFVLAILACDLFPSDL